MTAAANVTITRDNGEGEFTVTLDGPVVTGQVDATVMVDAAGSAFVEFHLSPANRATPDPTAVRAWNGREHVNPVTVGDEHYCGEVSFYERYDSTADGLVRTFEPDPTRHHMRGLVHGRLTPHAELPPIYDALRVAAEAITTPKHRAQTVLRQAKLRHMDKRQALADAQVEADEASRDVQAAYDTLYQATV